MTMPHLTPGQVIEILERGALNDLIGAIEDDRLEAKGDPYRIDEPQERLELAKDVVALANARGGVIVIGAGTDRSPAHLGDEVRRIGTFPEALLDRDRYRQILGDWVYPALEGLDITWFRSGNDAARGIVAITIPNQPERLRPFLVAHTLIEPAGRYRDIIFGYTERHHSHAEPLRVDDLHRLLRDGRQAVDLDARFDVILEEIQRRAPRPLEGPRPLDLLSGRRDEAKRTARLEEAPTITLAAIPTSPLEIPGLFGGRDSALVRLLDNPPQLRHGSFHLAGGTSRIVRGELRRSLGWGVFLDLWRDGTLLGAGLAVDFICWGTANLTRPAVLRINPLALVELVYLFVELSRQIFEQAAPPPDQLEYFLSLQDMILSGRRALLTPGPRRSRAFQFGMDLHEAHDDNADFRAAARWRDLHTGVVTYALLANLYAWFEFEEEDIPYREFLPDGRRAISPEQIREDGAGR